MCDFDITSFRERNVSRKKQKEKENASKDTKASSSGSSYEIYMEKRRMMGLDDSDSNSDSSSSSSNDSEGKKKRKKKKKITVPLRPSLLSDDEQQFTQPIEASSPPSVETQPSSTLVDEEPRSMTSHMLSSDDDDDLPTLARTTVQLSEKSVIFHDLTTSDPSYEQDPPKRTPEPIPLAMEIEDLDPDLALIAAGNFIPSSILDDGDSANDISKQKSEPRRIEIKVQFVCVNPPEDVKLKSVVDMLSKPVKIIVMDNDQLDLLLTHYCKRKLLRKEDVLLVHQNVPVVLRATPASLGMLPSTHNVIEVYIKRDYNAKIERELEAKRKMLDGLRSKPDPEGEDDFMDDIEFKAAERESQDNENGRLFIKLRGRDNVDVTMRVKQTTTMQTIIKEYVRIRELNLEVASQVKLSFDGEILNPGMTIQEADLEDEDLISVMI